MRRNGQHNSTGDCLYEADLFLNPRPPVRPGILFDDTSTILDLSPNGFSSTLDVITRASTSALPA